MAQYGVGIDCPMSACGDLDTAQYKFVKLTGTGKNVMLSTGASGPAPLGVLQNDPESGGAAAVRVLGSTKVWFSGSTAVDPGDFIMSGSAGGAEKHGAVAGSAAQGIALEACTAGTGYIEVFLFPLYPILWDNMP